jgi:hypothetical protein
MIVVFVAVTASSMESETVTPYRFTLLSVVGLDEVELIIVEVPVIPKLEAVDVVV